MKTETLTMFITEDGVKHDTEEAAKKHEDEVISRRKQLKWFRVAHNPDLTEGRGWYGCTTIAVECLYGPAEEFARDWCYRAFGSHVAYVQGCSAMFNWKLRELTEEPNPLVSSARVGDYEHAGNIIFLSDGAKMKGLPDPSPLRGPDATSP